MPPWNALQMMFHRFNSRIVAYDSWFGEIDSWSWGSGLVC
jgi:hypothetical protein